MNIDNLSAAVSTRDRLRDLQRQHRLVSEGKGLGVTIQSTYQDDSFVDAVRPAVLTEITRRIEEAQDQLRTLGVDCTRGTEAQSGTNERE